MTRSGAATSRPCYMRLAENVEWEAWAEHRGMAAGEPWLQRCTSRAAVQNLLELIAEDFDVQEFSVVELTANASSVFAQVHIEAFVRSTGRWLRDDEIEVWMFDDEGRVVRLRHYVDGTKHREVATKP
jgi:ketosteroid isomerase-like protein